MLQALGLLALRPDYHDTLLKYDLPDTIMSLILPGEELYYTNQTTKYAKYVKHLAARVLVYLGLFSKLSNKLNLFDILGQCCVVLKFFFLCLKLELFFLFIADRIPCGCD
jgi:hypothetical protein